MSELDDVLKALRDKHRATARYTIYLTRTNFAQGHDVIETGLTWEVADRRRNELNDARERKSFGSPMYGIKLETGENDGTLRHS